MIIEICILICKEVLFDKISHLKYYKCMLLSIPRNERYRFVGFFLEVKVC